MRTLGLVLLGASQYEHHKELNNPRFANSSREFRKLATDAEINLDRTTEVLDLYNKPLLPSDVATRVTDFIAKDFDDFIVYYCGHGDVGRREGDYRVFLRQSHRNRRHGTLLHIAGLIHDIQGMSSRITGGAHGNAGSASRPSTSSMPHLTSAAVPAPIRGAVSIVTFDPKAVLPGQQVEINCRGSGGPCGNISARLRLPELWQRGSRPPTGGMIARTAVKPRRDEPQ